VTLRKLRPLEAALGFSLLVHAALLTIRFVDPQALDRAFQDTPLEVILVNGRSAVRPDKALAIAQSNMAGGGDAAAGRATSPLAAAAVSEQGDTVEEKARERNRSLQQQQTMLLAQVRRQIATLPVPDPKSTRPTPEQAAAEERRRLLVKQLAEIEQRINAENARPRRHYVGPSTREEAYAVYYDRMRRAIEAKGTEDFPATSSGRKLYGELTMVVTVDQRGNVIGTEIAEGSGSRGLDRRAEAIVRASGPFGRFNAAMRREAEQIVVVSRFRFSRDDTVQARMSTAP
jgi:protein TonB